MSDQPAEIPVVCALIERDERVLIAQRPADKHLALKWEFPGGKVERGESPVDALLREIREELGCVLEQLVALPASRHDYGTIQISMLPYVAAIAPGSPDPVPHEHVSIRWVRAEELLAVDLAAADLPVVHAYLAWRTGHHGA